MAGEPIEVEVFYDDGEELDKAKDALTSVRPDVRVYRGVVEGWADAGALEALLDAGLLVNPLKPPGAAEPAAIASELAEAPEPPAADDEALRELRRQSRYVARTDEGLTLLEEAVPEQELDLTIHDPGGARVLQPAPEDAPGEAVYHIRLRGLMTQEQGALFEQMGISLAAYEPPTSYRTFLTSDQYAQVLALDFVEAVERSTLEDTVTPEVLETVAGADAAAEGPSLLGDDGAAPERATYDCVLHRIADREETVALIGSLEGVEIVDSAYLYIRFRAPKDMRILAAVSKLPQVRRVGLFTPPLLMVDHARVMVGAEAIPPAPGGLTGAGEKVAIFDSGVDRTHPDLTDRIESVEAIPEATEDDKDGHGTHVAGIVAGTGAASNDKVRGVAPGAKLNVVGVVRMEGRQATVLTPVHWPTTLQRAVDKGAKIVNLSLGNQVQAWYDFESMSMDQFVYDNPDVLVVVAAGNDGTAPKGHAMIKTVRSPASAKNVLTVGASSSNRVLDPPVTWRERSQGKFSAAPSSDVLVCGGPDAPAPSSSRGPTEFDSVKPDLLAPGTQILATWAAGAIRSPWSPAFTEYGGKYAYLGGTSMATPVVAGAAALLREYLRTQCDNPAPSAALMKALLVAAARKIEPRAMPDYVEAVGFPDFDQGFGRLDLATILPGATGASPRRRLLCVDWPKDSDEALTSRPQDLPGRDLKRKRVYRVVVPDGATEPLQVVLTWIDWPSAHVQNNLHLEVTGQTVNLPGNPDHHWGRQEEKMLKDLVADKTFGVIDKNNNVEKITIEAPQPGEYDVTVLAQNTPFAPQGYALCVAGEIDGDLQAVE
ncbi:MAG: S8 family serine peptidase [Actinomycetota bacterium]|nr:S8 family serine peptidase [Actinomycetota bacterium]